MKYRKRQSKPKAPVVATVIEGEKSKKPRKRSKVEYYQRQYQREYDMLLQMFDDRQRIRGTYLDELPNEILNEITNIFRTKIYEYTGRLTRKDIAEIRWLVVNYDVVILINEPLMSGIKEIDEQMIKRRCLYKTKGIVNSDGRTFWDCLYKTNGLVNKYDDYALDIFFDNNVYYGFRIYRNKGHMDILDRIGFHCINFKSIKFYIKGKRKERTIWGRMFGRYFIYKSEIIVFLVLMMIYVVVLDWIDELYKMIIGINYKNDFR